MCVSISATFLTIDGTTLAPTIKTIIPQTKPFFTQLFRIKTYPPLTFAIPYGF
jgi:hypothetical protein